MKIAKYVVGFLAALFGVIANIGGYRAYNLASIRNFFPDEFSASGAILVWFTMLSITLWIVFIVLMLVPTEKKSSSKK